MTHQSRMLLTIAVLSVVGVSALMYMANRYVNVVEERSGASSSSTAVISAPVREPMWKKAATAQALARVDRFIGVRSRIRAEIDRRGGALDGPGAFDDLRARVLTDSGMTLADYGGVRETFRSWCDGRLRQSSFMAAAFEQRKAALERLDLGELEAQDS